MKYRVDIRVVPRAGLLDPQGKAIESALLALEFGGIGAVHVGRAITLELEADSEQSAESEARRMCERLLANPVTEDFSVKVSA